MDMEQRDEQVGAALLRCALVAFGPFSTVKWPNLLHRDEGTSAGLA